MVLGSYRNVGSAARGASCRGSTNVHSDGLVGFERVVMKRLREGTVVIEDAEI